jgi:hypothetical protein
MTAAKLSWRDILGVHPAAARFPPMPPDELKALGEDIRKHGLREPVVVIRQYRRREDGKLDLREYDLVLIDGRNRLDAMELAGFVLVRDGKLDPKLGHEALGLEPLSGGGYAEFEFDSDDEVYAFVFSRNYHRRHLSSEQRQHCLIEHIARTPEKSDRQIGKEIGVEHKAIARARAKGEATGAVAPVEKRVGGDGRARKQPTKRNLTRAMHHRRMKLGDDIVDSLEGTSLDNARELDELITLNRNAPKGGLTKPVQQLVAAAKAGEDVSAIAYSKCGGAFRGEDIGPDNARKLTRVEELEDKNRQLTRVEELEHANRELVIRMYGYESEFEEQISRLPATRLLGFLEAALARDGIDDMAVPLRALRARIEQAKPMINLEAAPPAGNA